MSSLSLRTTGGWNVCVSERGNASEGARGRVCSCDRQVRRLDRGGWGAKGSGDLTSNYFSKTRELVKRLCMIPPARSAWSCWL